MRDHSCDANASSDCLAYRFFYHGGGYVGYHRDCKPHQQISAVFPIVQLKWLVPQILTSSNRLYLRRCVLLTLQTCR